METNKILQKIFTEYDTTVKEFCKEAEIKSPSSLYNWMDGTIVLSYDRLFSILDNLKIKYKVNLEIE